MIDEQLDQNDVVISSRIRLARNIADFPFVNTCSDDQRAEIEASVRQQLTQDDQLGHVSFVDSFELEALERQFLMDLKLIGVPTYETPKLESLGDSSGSLDDTTPDSMLDSVVDELRADLVSAEFDDAAITERETLDVVAASCLTINEEDHLRITVTRNDPDLQAAWDQINQLDDQIEQHLNYAFSPRWGYLTACPANVGTGMRVSVMVHLPALALTGQSDKVFRSLQKVNVVARGVFGENALGDFYRISNQATLGIHETDLIEQVTDVIPQLIMFERQAREFLLDENREGLRRDVVLALEQICNWDLDDVSEESNKQILNLLSKVRMGVGMGLLSQQDANRVNRLFALVQMRHDLLTAIAREDYQRASELRDQIQQIEQGPTGTGGQNEWFHEDDPLFGELFDRKEIDDDSCGDASDDVGDSR